MGPGNIAYFAYIVPPQGYHTEGIINRFQSNFIYLNLTYWMRTIFCRFMHNKCSHISYVSWYSRCRMWGLMNRYLRQTAREPLDH